MTHRMMLLSIQLGVIIFAARLGHILFEKLKVPGVLGELSVGILIGPYMLGHLPFPGFREGLFPLFSAAFPVSPELYGFCSTAAIVLLFMVGLETDIKLFMRYSLAGGLVGVGGVVFSYLGGSLVALKFLTMMTGGSYTFWSPECILLGVISTATSVGITARILSEKRKMDSPEGVTILAGAVIDDVLGIIMLAVGLGVISASESSGRVDWAHIGVIAGKAVGIWLVATAVGLVASHRIGFLLKLFRKRSSIAMMSLGLALMLAGLFEEAKLAMIIGAYVAGLSLSRTDIKLVIRENIEPIYDLLVPIFFAVMGMLVDVHLVMSSKVLAFGLIYTVVAVIAKLIGCGLPAMACNYNWRGALRIGLGMLPRGEVALIVAGIGLATGKMSQEVFGVAVLMTLATTVLAPPALVAAFKSARSGLRRESKENGEQDETVLFSFPSENTAKLLVSKLMEAFSSEGFFVHTLHRDERLHQLRKDAVVIGLQQHGSEIAFECSRSEAAFVNTAMLEVVADLEQTVRELRRPIDKTAIGLRIQGQAPSKPSMTLGGYVSPAVLTPRLKGSSKEAVIDELLQLLVKSGALKDAAAARKAIFEREESMSTGMQYGIAIPHARTDMVGSLVCAIGLHPEGVDFDAIDGQPSQIFVLTLSPRSAAAPHMQFMSMVSQVLDEQGRVSLLSCESPQEMYDVLNGGSAPRRVMATSVEPAATPAAAASGLIETFRRDLMVCGLKGVSKESVIAELVGLLAKKGAIRDTRKVTDLVIEREREMSTGLEHGVAIPHARTDEVESLVCAVGVSQAGVDFGSLDGERSHIFVLTLSPAGAPVHHIQFMAIVSRALDKEGRALAMAARTPEDLYRVFVERAAKR